MTVYPKQLDYRPLASGLTPPFWERGGVCVTQGAVRGGCTPTRLAARLAHQVTDDPANVDEQGRRVVRMLLFELRSEHLQTGFQPYLTQLQRARIPPRECVVDMKPPRPEEWPEKPRCHVARSTAPSCHSVGMHALPIKVGRESLYNTMDSAGTNERAADLRRGFYC